MKIELNNGEFFGKKGLKSYPLKTISSGYVFIPKKREAQGISFWEKDKSIYISQRYFGDEQTGEGKRQMQIEIKLKDITSIEMLHWENRLDAAYIGVKIKANRIGLTDDIKINGGLIIKESCEVVYMFTPGEVRERSEWCMEESLKAYCSYHNCECHA